VKAETTVKDGGDALAALAAAAAMDGAPAGVDPAPRRQSNGRAGKRNLDKAVVAVLREWFVAHLDWPYPNDLEQAEPPPPPPSY
jgi:hypothetical protein